MADDDRNPVGASSVATTAVAPADLDPATVGDDVTVLVRGLHVSYRVYEDRRPQMREVLANGLRRPSYREIHAVRGIDLVSREGEAIGLIGHNGSGKSTLLQAMAGLLPPSQGEVFARAQPTLLGVSAALRPAVSGRRNIILGGLALGMSREQVAAQIDDVIEFTGLEDFIDLPIRTYSSGMRARLHFAIATAVEPEILLIDEALSVGDEDFKAKSLERIDRLTERAGTVFLVSHSLGTIREMCTRCIWIHEGQIRADGDPDDIVAEYRRVTKGRRGKKRRKKG